MQASYEKREQLSPIDEAVTSLSPPEKAASLTNKDKNDTKRYSKI